MPEYTEPFLYFGQPVDADSMVEILCESDFSQSMLASYINHEREYSSDHTNLSVYQADHFHGASSIDVRVDFNKFTNAQLIRLIKWNPSVALFLEDCDNALFTFIANNDTSIIPRLNVDLDYGKVKIAVEAYARSNHYDRYRLEWFNRDVIAKKGLAKDYGLKKAFWEALMGRFYKSYDDDVYLPYGVYCGHPNVRFDNLFGSDYTDDGTYIHNAQGEHYEDIAPVIADWVRSNNLKTKHIVRSFNSSNYDEQKKLVPLYEAALENDFSEASIKEIPDVAYPEIKQTVNKLKLKYPDRVGS